MLLVLVELYLPFGRKILKEKKEALRRILIAEAVWEKVIYIVLKLRIMHGNLLIRLPGAHFDIEDHKISEAVIDKFTDDLIRLFVGGKFMRKLKQCSHLPLFHAIMGTQNHFYSYFRCFMSATFLFSSGQLLHFDSLLLKLILHLILKF